MSTRARSSIRRRRSSPALASVREAAIGAGSVVAANATLAANVVVGRDCWIHSGVVIREECELGDRVVLQPGVVLGSDGFGLVADEQGRPAAMAHRGRVVIEDDVEIGANTTVDRATLDETRIRRGAKIDNLVQIAHNCDIGENALIVAQSGFSGGTIVGAGAIVMAQAGTTGHLRIGARAFVGARAGLHHDVPDGERVFGSPAMEERTWHRAMAALKRLPELLRCGAQRTGSSSAPDIRLWRGRRFARRLRPGLTRAEDPPMSTGEPEKLKKVALRPRALGGAPRGLCRLPRRQRARCARCGARARYRAPVPGSS